MYFSTLLLLATATFILPITAQNSTAEIGTNCDIVANKTVVAGDNLANIATAANVTIDQVQFVNTQIANPRLINVGDVIKIPDSRCVAPAAPALAEPTATCSNGTATTTEVVAGDSLIIIAKEKLGITLPALLAANPQITDPAVINVGDVINIPLCNNSTTAGGASNSTIGGASNSTAKVVSLRERGVAMRRRVQLTRRPL